MDRRQFLSLTIATPLFAGCTSLSSSEDSPDGTAENTLLGNRSPPSREDLDTALRPPAEEPPDATDETVPPIQYPTKPTTYDETSITQFVDAHERAYQRNEPLERLGGDLTDHTFWWHWTVSLGTSENAGVGRGQYRYAYTRQEDGTGTEVVSDGPRVVVTYYVDESMIVRAQKEGEASRRDELAPDPWESGVILEPAD